MKISDSPNGVIYAVEPDQNNDLWIGTNDFLYYYNQGKIVKFLNDHEIFKTTNINSRKVFNIKDILNDAGKLIIGEAQSFTMMEKGKVIYNSLFNDNIELRVETVEQIGEAEYLLGTLKGLWQYSKGKFEYLGSLSPLLSNRITDIEYISKHKLIIAGTKGYGIVIHSVDTTINITSANGLSSNSVTSLLITGNLLWVATNNGLNLLDLEKIGTEEMRIKIFTKQYGLISNEINQIAGNQNFIYIATNEGLTVFNRKNYKPVTVPPPIY
ncbi:MAG TPA: hypothetical protein DF409_12705, partial [Bacteroidales bacterium]|nr:hypothetical protein [Bacteroidales bacterium]